MCRTPVVVGRERLMDTTKTDAPPGCGMAVVLSALLWAVAIVVVFLILSAV